MEPMLDFYNLGIYRENNRIDAKKALGGLPNVDKLIKQFWDTVNNQKKVSINILSHKDIYIQQIDEKQIVVINVPRADRAYRPVYLDGNPL